MRKMGNKNESLMNFSLNIKNIEREVALEKIEIDKKIKKEFAENVFSKQSKIKSFIK